MSNPQKGTRPVGGVTLAPSPTVFPRKNTEGEIARMNRISLSEIISRPNYTPPDVMPTEAVNTLKQGNEVYPAPAHKAAK